MTCKQIYNTYIQVEEAQKEAKLSREAATHDKANAQEIGERLNAQLHALREEYDNFKEHTGLFVCAFVCVCVCQRVFCVNMCAYTHAHAHNRWCYE